MRLLRYLARLAVKTFLFGLLLWCAGLGWFVLQIPWHPGSSPEKTDAIVALTGGAERLDYALALLAEGKGKRLFISGVEDNATLRELYPRLSQRALVARYARMIDLGTIARDTKGNAQETADWMDMHHYTSMRLVTANYHMPRSLFEFRRLMPNIRIIPTPAFPAPFDSTGWMLSPAGILLVLSEYHKYLATRLHDVFL
jgi:uncharacterized SAM-binding protein YcdF (DUF218 family)